MKIRSLAIAITALLLTAIASPAWAMYHPGTGRFMQRDPGASSALATPRPGIAQPARLGRFIPQDQYRDGMSLYQYVNGNPINFVDPSGLILVAVDGTGSRTHLAGGPGTTTGRWFSHVRNFYDDYGEPPKAYWHGPDANLPGPAGREVGGIIKGARQWVCEQWWPPSTMSRVMS